VLLNSGIEDKIKKKKKTSSSVHENEIRIIGLCCRTLQKNKYLIDLKSYGFEEATNDINHCIIITSFHDFFDLSP
jgi:hypothetical protein